MVELAYAFHTTPAAWAQASDEDIVTALAVLDDIAEARRGG
jgi:hypothetical protein